MAALAHGHGGSPATSSYLAAALGQLGDLANAARALARVRERVGVPATPTIASVRPEHRKLFEDGLALAEGKPHDAKGP